MHFANSAYFTESVNDILQRISAALEATTIPDSVMIGAKESLEENMKSTDSIRDIVNGSPSPIRTCSDSNSSQTTVSSSFSQTYLYTLLHLSDYYDA